MYISRVFQVQTNHNLADNDNLWSHMVQKWQILDVRIHWPLTVNKGQIPGGSTSENNIEPLKKIPCFYHKMQTTLNFDRLSAVLYVLFHSYVYRLL